MPVYPAAEASVLAPGLLAVKSYSPASDTDTTTASTTLVDLDAANLIVSFTAPPSGAVLVRLSGTGWMSSTSFNQRWGIRDASAIIAGPANVINANSVSYASPVFRVTGLVPGTTYTYRWAWATEGGTAHFRYGAPTYGPAVMEVWDAAPTYTQQILTGGVRPHKNFRRTAGDLSLNATVWSDMPTIGTSWDATLPAAIGDVVECSMGGIAGNQNASTGFDVQTIVGGSALNSGGSGAAVNNSHNGFPGWYCLSGANIIISGAMRYTLQAGDIVNGLVTLRLRFKQDIANARTLQASLANPTTFNVINLGQAMA